MDAEPVRRGLGGHAGVSTWRKRSQHDSVVQLGGGTCDGDYDDEYSRCDSDQNTQAANDSTR